MMAFVCAVCGAQPGVISGAAGATAVVFAPLVASHGLEYLFAAVLLAGVMQVTAGALRLGKFIRLVPQPVMLGFVNGLAIVIGSAQLAQFKSASGAWLTGQPLAVMLGLTALTMAIIKLLPKLTTAVPAPLLAILATTGASQALGLQTRTVGDLASIAGTLPAFHLPGVPWNLTTLAVVAPVAAGVAAVGLIETLVTQQLVDDITERRTSTHKECIGQGLGNIVNGVFGGMGGCAMIGQSMINVNAGGRTRVSGLTCAAALMSYVLVGSSFIEKIPLAALTGTMFMLVCDIFDWTSFKRLTQIPKTDAAVLCLVTGVTVVTNLAVAVFAGVVLASLGFAWKSAQRIEATREVEPTAYDDQPAAVFKLSGPLFFGSVASFKGVVDPKREPEKEIVFDFMSAKVWDSSALEAIDQLCVKFQEEGKRVHLRHLSADCRALLAKAGDLVEVNVLEDPAYAVAADNQDPERVEVVKPVLIDDKKKTSNVGSSTPGRSVGNDIDPRFFAALKRQYSADVTSNSNDTSGYKMYNFDD